MVSGDNQLANRILINFPFSGLATEPHDRAVIRAVNSKYISNQCLVSSEPRNTLFVGRLHDETCEETLRRQFSRFGKIQSVKLVRDIVTGLSKCYAFVEYRHRQDAKDAYREMHQKVIDNCQILVDFEHGRVMPGWKPRRLGGGLGGKKESGQLRFGCRDRPFRRATEEQQARGWSSGRSNSERRKSTKDESNNCN